METVTLKAEVRNETKKGPSRRLRVQGLVPAILYGSKQEPIMMAVDSADLLDIMKKERKEGVFVRLSFQRDGQAVERMSVLKDVQINSVKKRLDHADFYEIRMDRELTIEIPVILKGRAEGQDAGGDLQHPKRELKVAGLPGLIPEAVELDITSLKVGDTLKVGDVSLPEGVRMVDHDDIVIVHVATTRTSGQTGAEEAGGETGGAGSGEQSSSEGEES